MPITFHADLLGTTLEDFDSHFCVVLAYIDGFMRGRHGVPTLTFSSIRTEEFTEDRNNMVFPDVIWPRSGYTDVENAKSVLAQNLHRYEAAPEGEAGRLGYIQVVRSVRGPRVTYSVDLLAIVRAGEIQINQTSKGYFQVFAARYRQLRLKLLLYEEDAEKKPYATLLKDWVEPRWGNAVKPQELEDAPQTENSLQLPVGKMEYSPEDWDRLFDYIAQMPGTRPDYQKLAHVTAKQPDTVKKAYNDYHRRKQEAADSESPNRA